MKSKRNATKCPVRYQRTKFDGLSWCTCDVLEGAVVAGQPPPRSPLLALPLGGLLGALGGLRLTQAVVVLVQPAHLGAPRRVGHAEVPRLRREGPRQRLDKQK